MDNVNFGKYNDNFTLKILSNTKERGISANGCVQDRSKGAVDKVPELWKTEWINRRKRNFGAAGFPRNLLRYGHRGVLILKNSLEIAKRKALG